MSIEFEAKTAPEAYLQQEMQKLLDPTRLRAVLDWRMCSDPWPGGDMAAVDGWLNGASKMAGFDDWIDAYHRLPPNIEVSRGALAQAKTNDA